MLLLTVGTFGLCNIFCCYVEILLSVCNPEVELLT